MRRVAVLAVGFATVGLATALSPVPAADPTPQATGQFVPLTPARLVDTTSDIGWSGKLLPHATRSVTATGVAEVPATDVLAVMLHITTSNGAAAGAKANGNVWAWPAGAPRPRYGIVANPPAGSVADNTAIVRVGTAGQISFYNGARGTAVDVHADITGYVTSRGSRKGGAAFAPVTPSRIIDTSTGIGGRSTPLTSSADWTFHALDAGGIPGAGVSAIALNLRAGATGTNCWVQVQPAGSDTSNTAYPRVHTNANYTAQELAVVAPGANGDVTFSTTCASTDLYVDVEGYYLTSVAGSGSDVYVPINNPARIIDTRRHLGITGKLTAGRVVHGSSAVAVRRVAGVPSSADAVALSIGATNANAQGYNTIWTDGIAQPTGTRTIDVEPHVTESNLIFVATGRTGKIDIADPSTNPTESNDLYVDIEGYFYRPAPAVFSTPQYYPDVGGDAFYNTTGAGGGIVITSDDSPGANHTCKGRGSAISILRASGTDPADLKFTTVNCMTSFGPRTDGKTPDGCSWKNGGITRIGRVIYLVVARQLKKCSYGKETNGLQPSFDASIIKSSDGGRTWTNPWGTTSADGAAPPWDGELHRYKAMFPGRRFTVPFFIQYGPGNTHTVDGADKYLYAVSTEGYAYNASFLQLARVPLNKVQQRSAWQFYHGKVGGAGRHWTSSSVGATRILQAPHRVSQPAIQYVPALKRYVLMTFYWSRARSDFPSPAETPYARWRFYTAPKPWGPWTKVFEHTGRRSLWCTASPCHLIEEPGSIALTVGKPDDWLGAYAPSLVQKFLFTRKLDQQALLMDGDWKLPNRYRYPGEDLHVLHVVPVNLAALLR